MRPVAIQKGSGTSLVYLLHVGDAKPDARYPKGTFDAIREACGPDPTILVRGDDGTGAEMPLLDAPNLRDFSPIVMGGWSAGVRGIRRLLLELRRTAPLEPLGKRLEWLDGSLRGIVAADGLHAPWAVPSGEGPATTLGPSEVFHEWIERARQPCQKCRGEGRIHAMQGSGPECFDRCEACEGAGFGFAFVLTHCSQDYMEAPSSKPRYLSTKTVARELTGWPCDPNRHASDTAVDRTEKSEGRLEVHSYAGPRVDFAGHVRQLREALPAGLARMRDWGIL